MASGRLAVTAGSNCRTAPAAAFLVLANSRFAFCPERCKIRLFSSISVFSRSKPSRDMYISPRTSNVFGEFFARYLGTEVIVRTFSVTSSPCVPSPRVLARASSPFSYISDMARPSIFGSVTIAKLLRRVNSAVFLCQVRMPSASNALLRLSIGIRCSITLKGFRGGKPTCCVGESSVKNS